MIVGAMPALWLAVALAAQMFTPIGSLNFARAGHRATLLADGRILVTGGQDDAGNGIAQAELYNPSSGTWSVAASSLFARLEHAAVRLPDGRVLVAGGVSSLASRRTVTTAEIFDPVTGQWSVTELGAPDHTDPDAELRNRIGALIAGRAGYTVSRLADNSVLIAGGIVAGRVTAAVEIYVPEP